MKAEKYLHKHVQNFILGEMLILPCAEMLIQCAPCQDLTISFRSLNH